jgi:molybdopterin molybdotransferase
LDALIDTELRASRRLRVAVDFAFGYPTDATYRITGSRDPLAYWDWLDERIEDDLKTNNRFHVAGTINARFDGIGPFWGNGLKEDIPHLPRKGSTREPERHGFEERRMVEKRERGAFSVWQLSGAGAVGSQVLMGLPVLARLRRRFARRVSVWPFEPLETPVSFVEIWPTLFKADIAAGPYAHWISDAAQVHVTADVIARKSAHELARTLDIPANSEGWIFGVAP